MGNDPDIGSNYMLLPIASVHAPEGSPEDAYNYFESSARMHVEQACGQLLIRWRVLGSWLRSSLRATIKLIEAAMSLRNFCINANYIELGQFVPATEQKEADGMVHAWMAHIECTV